MCLRLTFAAIAPALIAALFARPTDAVETDPFWRVICATPGSHQVQLAALPEAQLPGVPLCGPAPAVFHELPSIGHGGDVTVALDVGFDPVASHLCFVNHVLSEAPVIRVGVGHRLTFTLKNTLHDTGPHRQVNCAMQVFGGESYCIRSPLFREEPGADGPYYPLAANQAHIADGTTNLHVHGFFVPPVPCSDEVLRSTIYPANWAGPVAPLQPCQTAPDELTYSYDLPQDHPSGLYWYHTHRHGTAEQQTQMGLVGAIVIEDSGDAKRAAIGVTDEVLIVTDTPRTGCIIGPACDGPNQPAAPAGHTLRQPNRAAARRAAAASGSVSSILDPRIDQVDQAGGCAQGAYSDAGGVELWTLLLNGAPVPELQNGDFPPDSELLSKTMQPGQRQIFRVVNAAADSFISPQLVLSQNGVETVQKLEVFARDGVGLADADGNRHFGSFDVANHPLIVPPSGRIEFVVHAPPAGATLYLDSAQVLPGCGGNAYPARRLLMVTSAGTPVDPGEPDDKDLLTDPGRLRNYLQTLNDKPTVHRTIVFAEYGRDFTYSIAKWLTGPPQPYDYNPALTDFYVTQVASDDGEVHEKDTAMIPFQSHNLKPQVVVHLHGRDSVTEEWEIENSTLEIHAFHMHQIHFRDITDPGADPDLHPVLDVINFPAAPLIGDVASGYPGAPGRLKLLMHFTRADIGEFVFHCHILEHEDSGMMSKIQVVAD